MALTENKRPIKKHYLDLFSGIGGFALGAFWAGIKFDDHYFSEVDKYAISIYQKRFPEAMPLGDIKRIEGTKLPKGRWIMSGGFPCQDISIAGKGAGLDGDRSILWYEYQRLIGEIRPEFAIMENVGAITFRGLDRVLGSLAEIGYDAEWQDIRASDLGSPHKRERIWILAYPEKCRFTGCNALQGNSEILKKRGDKNRNNNKAGKDGDSIIKCVGQSIPETGKPDRKNKDRGAAISCPPGEGLEGYGNNAGEPPFIEPWDNNQIKRIKEWWSIEPDVGRLANGVSNRVDRLKCLGNTVVPQIPMMIWLMIKYYFDMDKA
jgi:DNA (cytosine-5)-methyltransferase 1